MIKWIKFNVNGDVHYLNVQNISSIVYFECERVLEITMTNRDRFTRSFTIEKYNDLKRELEIDND